MDFITNISIISALNSKEINGFITDFRTENKCKKYSFEVLITKRIINKRIV